MDLVIKEVHVINNNDKQFILAYYADDIAQTAVVQANNAKFGVVLEKCGTYSCFQWILTI